MRACKFLAQVCYFSQHPPSVGALQTDIILPFEETQSLSKAELCLAAHRAYSLCVSGLSHRRQCDCFEYQGIRGLLPALAFDLRTATSAAYFRVAVLHRPRASADELAGTLQAASGWRRDH